jgi:hypothetical protein
MSKTGLSFDNRQLIKLLVGLKAKLNSYDSSVFDVNPYRELKLKVQFDDGNPDGDILFHMSQNPPPEKWTFGNFPKREPFDPKDKMLELIQKIIEYVEKKPGSGQKINFDVPYCMKLKLCPDHPDGMNLKSYQRGPNSESRDVVLNRLFK